MFRGVEEVLDDNSTAQWLADIEDACRRTATDGKHRTVRHGGNAAEVFPQGQRPGACVSEGPSLASDLWKRVAARLGEKIEQTRGGPPAWLRIDDIGTMFHLTDWSAAPLPDRLAQLRHNIGITLADAPHVRGVILTGGDQPASSQSVGETAWFRNGQIKVPSATPPRETLAHGPVAMRRPLPGDRQRLTFVLPTQHSHLLLLAGTGLEPGLWYDREATWLDRALHALGHPPLATLLPT